MVDIVNTSDADDVSALVSPMREKLRQTVTLNADPPANSKTSARSDVCAEQKEKVSQLDVCAEQKEQVSQLDDVEQDQLQKLLSQYLPDDKLLKTRESALNRLRGIVRETCGSCCKLKIFGSVASGTDLKTSDLDIVVESNPHVEPLTLLDVLESKLCKFVKGKASKTEIVKSAGATCDDSRLSTDATSNDDSSLLVAIRRAKIPLLKVDKRLWGVDLDISFNSTEGLTNTRFVKGLVDRPDLKPLQMLVRMVKLWRDARSLPDASCYGLGSFAWLLMATFALQSSENSNKCSSETALRTFFTCFVNFDYLNTAVCVRGNRGVAVENPWQMHDEFRPAQLVVLDPCTHPLAPPRNVISGLRTAQMIFVHAELERGRELLESGMVLSVFSRDGACNLTDRLAQFKPPPTTASSPEPLSTAAESSSKSPSFSAAPSAPHIDLVLVLGSGRQQTIRLARVLELKWRNNVPSPSTRDVVHLGVQLFVSTDTEGGAAANRFVLKPDLVYAVPVDIICVADMELCDKSDSLWRPSASCQERLRRFNSSLIALRSVAAKPAKRPRLDQSFSSTVASRKRFTHPGVHWMPPPPHGYWAHHPVPAPFPHPGGVQGPGWSNWARPPYGHRKQHHRNGNRGSPKFSSRGRAHNNDRSQWRPR